MAEEIEVVAVRNLNQERSIENGPELNNSRFFQFIIRHQYISCLVCIIAFALFIGIGAVFFVNNLETCKTYGCNDISKFILDHMNQSVNPCENFYDFVCKKEIRYSKRTIVKHHLIDILKSFIEQINDNSPKYLKKLKKNYNACVDYVISADVLKKKLNNVGVWPILNKGTSWKETEFHWIESIHKLYHEGIPAVYFLSFSFIPDEKNSSKNNIHLDQPSLGFPRKLLLEGLHSDMVKSYFNAMVNATKSLGGKDNATQDLEEVLNFEMELAKILLSKNERTNMKRLYTALSVAELETKYPEIEWLEYFNGILAPYTKINASEVIYVATSYIDKFYDLMTNRKPPNRILANYIFWRATNDMGGQEFSSPMFKDIKLNTWLKEQRHFTCTALMNKEMYLATSALFVRFSDLDSTIVEVKGMSRNIRKAFLRIIEKNDWLNNKMKDKVLRKISNINMFFAYPTQLLNDTLLDAYYKDLEIPNKSYFINTLRLRLFLMKKIFENFKMPYDMSDWTKKYGDVIKINPVYASKNIIYIPAGIMHSLYYSLDIPKYMNYGMLGGIVGHKIAHSLSPDLRFHDERGTLRKDWWDPRSSKIFMNKTQCIVEKYNNYKYEEFGFSLNGTNTLDENTADINGLKSAYDAYIEYTKFKQDELLLPGFEKYTPKQMFWIAYGSTWCSSEETVNSAKQQILEDNHSPSRYRVIGSVTSIKEFAEDFNCQSTDAMNPFEKCPLWF